MGIFLSLYFAKAAWTASVCKSKRAHRHRLAWIMNAIQTLGKHTHMITRSETFIPGVTCPGLVVFGTWVKSLGGGFDPVVNLQRRIYTCKKKWHQNRHNLKYCTDNILVIKRLFFAKGTTVLRSAAGYYSIKSSIPKLNDNPLLRLISSNTVACSWECEKVFTLINLYF